jgi:hypothetical protein
MGFQKIYSFPICKLFKKVPDFQIAKVWNGFGFEPASYGQQSEMLTTVPRYHSRVVSLKETIGITRFLYSTR